MAEVFTSLTDPKLAVLLKGGAVGILPTDTVYGLVCRAADKRAVERLYSLKKRENKPGTVIAASIEQLVELGVKSRYLKAVEQFWPNRISVVIPSEQELAYLHLGLGSLAVRIPNNAGLQALLVKTGPLLTTSANPPGQPVSDTVSEAQAYFDDNVDFYANGGVLSGQQPSTVIRILDDAVEVLRQGVVKIDETGRIL